MVYGALFENMIIVDLIKNFYAQGLRHAMTFFRDNNQNEVDLIIELVGKVIPVEIKSSETMNSSFFDMLSWFQDQTNNKETAVVVYGGDQNQKRSHGTFVSWKNVKSIYQD